MSRPQNMAPSSLLEVLIQQLGVICCMQCGEDLMGKQHRMFHLAGCRPMCIVVASREREPLVRAQMKHTRKKQQHCKQDSEEALDLSSLAQPWVGTHRQLFYAKATSICDCCKVLLCRARLLKSCYICTAPVLRVKC